jgi:serine/threonine protein kinase
MLPETLVDFECSIDTALDELEMILGFLNPDRYQTLQSTLTALKHVSFQVRLQLAASQLVSDGCTQFEEALVKVELERYEHEGLCAVLRTAREDILPLLMEEFAPPASGDTSLRLTLASASGEHHFKKTQKTRYRRLNPRLVQREGWEVAPVQDFMDDRVLIAQGIAIARCSAEDYALFRLKFAAAERLMKIQVDRSHANVLTVMSCLMTADGKHMTIMAEDLRGQCLEDHLEKLRQDIGRLTPLDAVRLHWHVSRGIEFGHQQHIVHTNIKPSNIFLRVDDDTLIPVVGDFLDQREGVCRNGLFDAPEVGYQTITGKADVYSLGVLLLFLLQGGTMPDEMICPSVKDRIFDAWKKWGGWRNGKAGEVHLFLQSMLAETPEDRPEIGEVVKAMAQFFAYLS